MSADQLLLCVLLGLVVLMLVTEWAPLEVTALLTMGCLALTGLVPPEAALSGFSSPAVVTIWAVFILSGGLDRTGVADHLGRLVQRFAGRSEMGLVTVLMVSAGVLSAFMNNVAVAALMLPVTMDLARRNHISPSRLLLPLAYGCLLGGLTTMIGTPPNILVSNALHEAALPAFGLFDFTPIGGIIMLAGTLFMVLVGLRMLPHRDVASAAIPTDRELTDQYDLQERTFALIVPAGSPLIGRTLEESRLGAAVGLNVVAVFHGEQTLVAPHPATRFTAGDRLFVQGRLERVGDLQALTNLISAESCWQPETLEKAGLSLAEAWFPENSPLIGQTVSAALDGPLAGWEVLALRREPEVWYENWAERTLRSSDRLLVLLPAEALAKQPPADRTELYRCEPADPGKLHEDYRLDEHLVRLQIVDDPDLAEIAMDLARIETILGIKALLTISPDGQVFTPGEGDQVSVGSQVLAVQASGSMETIRGLATLQVDETARPAEVLETGKVGLAEAVLAPRSALAGKTLRRLRFRENFGVGVLAIWRAGRAYRSNLRDMPLEFGDALLLFGPLKNLQGLAGHPDLIVLSHTEKQLPRSEKAVVAGVVMAATLLPVLVGLVPIHLAVVIGAACMVLTRCLTMEEAYRAIEWRAVFLIAGLLPLGIALERSGMAAMVAHQIVALTRDQHPVMLMAGLVALTFLATCVIPTAALVLLMAPLALSTAAEAGLSPHSLLMAISMAASASFLTPIAHPANILVMGPGGYRFRDYLRIGLPLTVVVFVVILWFVPIFWPLRP